MYYKVYYTGDNLRFKGFSEVVEANSRREAVEKVYQLYLDDNYFPFDDGTIKDCAGDIIATATDDCIKFDGDFFLAEELDEPY